MVDKDHADRPASHRDLQKRPESTRIDYLCYPGTLTLSSRALLVSPSECARVSCAPRRTCHQPSESMAVSSSTREYSVCAP